MDKILYYCKKCGKPVYTNFGSGKYCSRSCANSRTMTEQKRLNISNGLKKETNCECRYCGKKFKTLNSRANHEKLCSVNPNSSSPIRRFKDKTKPYKIGDSILDVNLEFIENYRKDHTTCEICGRSIEEAVKWKSDFAPKKLCVDHDHRTNKFRGLLCSVCNRQLGWYEENKDKINNYLSK